MKNYKAELQEMEAHTGPCFASNCDKMHLTPQTIDKLLMLFREIAKEATKLQSLPACIHAEEGNSRPRKDECPWCWEKEGGFHKPDCKWNEVNTQNNTRSEILSNIEKVI